MCPTCEVEYGDKSMPDWTDPTVNDFTLSISDAIRATAEAELKSMEDEQDGNYATKEEDKETNSDYVYDPSSGFYYHPLTGYYWDPNSGLFYDYTSGTYFQYDETSGEYEVHSQIDTQASSVSSQPVIYENCLKNDVQSLTIQLSALELDAQTCRKNALAMAENYPPCIRVIVEESEKLCAGTLFIVTCAGGTIGRDTTAKHIIEIPDIGVSKSHASFEYDYEQSCYNIKDLGSQNGTRVNGERLSQSKGDGYHIITHGDILHVGSGTKLLLHIHKGHETCEDCEPGQIQAKLKALNTVKNSHIVMTVTDKKQQQKKELKKIKKKYGLQNSYFENEGAVPKDPDYADKAYLRRRYVGSENESSVVERPASVHNPIASSNKGHKLLAKMGWKEGQGLGKTCAGIAEPINVELRVNQNAGLGSTAGHSLSLDRVQDSNKAKRWTQARERFNQLPPTNKPSNRSKNSNAQMGPPMNHNADLQITSANEPSGASTNNTSVPLSSPIAKSLKTNVSTKPQISWHKGGTEVLSNNVSDNKDS